MSMLEEKIRKNREVFDGTEPGDGHIERFEARLDSLHQARPVAQSKNISPFLRVAAIIVVLVGLSITFYLTSPNPLANQLSASTLPKEIQEARMYYSQLTEEKLMKINECAASSSEASYIRKVVTDEIRNLDSNSVNLEQQLSNDQGNQRLINALLKNYKTKSDLLDNILNRLCHI